MKRLFPVSTFVGAALWALTACEPQNPPQPTPQPQEDSIPATQEDTIPSSFPKKNLLEEFTGQGCIWCPNGMAAIHETVGNDSNWITILHHYGYTQDNFSVAGSDIITRQLGVSGAPNMTVNRSATKYKDENNRNQSSVVFHPGYFPGTDLSQFEKSTYASIELKNEYNPSSRELTICASGMVAKKDADGLKLTVVLKESGMIDTQSDYYTFAGGWTEFRHADAVRAYLTDPTGDSVAISGQRYADTLRFTLSDQWVAENCMVVAFLSEDFRPVVQAEQAPVVKGTKGGADITPGGITAIPVASYYPESDATTGPLDYSKQETDTLPVAKAYYEKLPELGVTRWTIEAYNESRKVRIKLTQSIPFVQIFFYTDIHTPVDAVPAGTYEFLNTGAAGTAAAGIRDDKRQEIEGSIFYYLNANYFKNGSYRVMSQWLIANGTLRITDSEWSVTGHSLNGSDIRIAGGNIPISEK